MNPDNVVNYINNTATNILKQFYYEDSTNITIEGINLSFINKEDYKVIVSFTLADINSTFEMESIVGLPNNPFLFTENDAFAFSVHLANIIINLYKTNSIVGYMPEEPTVLC
jgi:hypothetical protein